MWHHSYSQGLSGLNGNIRYAAKNNSSCQVFGLVFIRAGSSYLENLVKIWYLLKAQNKREKKQFFLKFKFWKTCLCVKWIRTNHIPKYKRALCLKRPDITTLCLSSCQAQLRVQESSQKLDLLRLSLEKCLKENNQGPTTACRGGQPVNLSEEPPSPRSSRPGCPVSTSSSIFSIRPASLTGIYHCNDLKKIF